MDRFKKYQAVHGIHDAPTPVAIVNAESTEDVAAVLAFADEHVVNVVPRTGRTGTEGGLETSVVDTIVLDCSRMDAVLRVDEENMQVTVQAGVPLQRLEDELRTLGLTTGHSPQSKPLAQYGGLVATRSIGQFSTLYGAIEDMVVGLEAVFPGGAVRRIKAVPRRSAGPDIRHVVIGNEGALCVITEVTVKVFRHQPENNEFHGALVDDMRTGIAILREVVVNGFHPSSSGSTRPRTRTSTSRTSRRASAWSSSSPRGRRASSARRARRSSACSTSTRTPRWTRPVSSSGSTSSTGGRTRSTPRRPRCSVTGTSATRRRSPPTGPPSAMSTTPSCAASGPSTRTPTT